VSLKSSPSIAATVPNPLIAVTGRFQTDLRLYRYPGSHFSILGPSQSHNRSRFLSNSPTKLYAHRPRFRCNIKHATPDLLETCHAMKIALVFINTEAPASSARGFAMPLTFWRLLASKCMQHAPISLTIYTPRKRHSTPHLIYPRQPPSLIHTSIKTNDTTKKGRVRQDVRLSCLDNITDLIWQTAHQPLL
jgi:hypothetical protein